MTDPRSSKDSNDIQAAMLRSSPNAKPTLALLSLALAGCDPQPLSLGFDQKEDSAGGGDPIEPLWTALVPDVQGFDMVVGPDGAAHVVGGTDSYTGSFGVEYGSLWLGKLDAAGSLVWSVTEPFAATTSALRYPKKIELDGDGDLYVVVSALDEGSYLTKRDPQGSELWTVPIAGEPSDMVARPEGGVIVVSEMTVDGDGDFSLVQSLDADGDLVWSRELFDSTMTYRWASDVALAADGRLAVGGLQSIAGRPPEVLQVWMSELDPADGTELWEIGLTEVDPGGSVTGWLSEIGATAEGTWLVSGELWYAEVVDGEQVTVEEPWVRSIAPDGTEQWSWKNAFAELATSFGVFADGSFAVAEPHYACTDDDGSPCPSTVDVMHVEADRELDWSTNVSACSDPIAVAPMTSGGLLLLATCEVEGAELGMGLLHYDP